MGGCCSHNAHEQAEKIRYLNASIIHLFLDDAALEMFADVCELLHVPRDTTVFLEGDECTSFFVVGQGQVGIYAQSGKSGVRALPVRASRRFSASAIDAPPRRRPTYRLRRKSTKVHPVPAASSGNDAPAPGRRASGSSKNHQSNAPVTHADDDTAKLVKMSSSSAVAPPRAAMEDIAERKEEEDRNRNTTAALERAVVHGARSTDSSAEDLDTSGRQSTHGAHKATERPAQSRGSLARDRDMRAAVERTHSNKSESLCVAPALQAHAAANSAGKGKPPSMSRFSAPNSSLQETENGQLLSLRHAGSIFGHVGFVRDPTSPRDNAAVACLNSVLLRCDLQAFRKLDERVQSLLREALKACGNNVRNIDVEEFVRSTPLFAGLEELYVQYLAATMHRIHFEKDDVLYTEGHYEKHDRSLYVVKRGLMQSVAFNEDGTREVLASFHPGDWFGEISCLADVPRPSTTIAAEPSLIMELTVDDYERLRSLSAVSTFSQLLWKSLAQRVASYFIRYKIPVWSTIPRDKYLLFSRLGRILVVEPNTFIFHAGSPADTFYMIFAGTISIKVPKLRDSSPVAQATNNRHRYRQTMSVAVNRATVSTHSTASGVSRPIDSKDQLSAPGQTHQMPKRADSESKHSQKSKPSRVPSPPDKLKGMVEIRRLSAGNYFGERALFHKKTQVVAAQAIERCVLIALPYKSFRTLYQQLPETIAQVELEAAKYNISFQAVLRHPAGFDYFSQYLRLEFADENIMFYKAVKDYAAKFRKSTDADIAARRAAALAIYDDYLSDNSPTMVMVDVNLKDDVRKSVCELREPTYDTFSQCQRQIYENMQRDSFPRFKQSQLFQKFLTHSREKEVKMRRSSSTTVLSHVQRSEWARPSRVSTQDLEARKLGGRPSAWSVRTSGRSSGRSLASGKMLDQIQVDRPPAPVLVSPVAVSAADRNSRVLDTPPSAHMRSLTPMSSVGKSMHVDTSVSVSTRPGPSVSKETRSLSYKKLHTPSK